MVLARPVPRGQPNPYISVPSVAWAVIAANSAPRRTQRPGAWGAGSGPARIAQVNRGSPTAGNGGASGHEGAAKPAAPHRRDRKSTRLNSSHVKISYAVFCLK